MRYVIIGNGPAGVGAAEAIRNVDAHGEITIVGEEPYHVYSRPLIAHYVAGEVTEPEMAFRPPDFYQSKGIVARLGVKATGLDVANRTVTLSDGSSLTWDRLLLATGSVQTFPPIPGADLPGVCDFWTLDHARAVLARVQAARSKGQVTAVVVGAGLIGLQAAHGLHSAGAKVIIIELLPYILSRVLDKEGAMLAQSILERGGIEVRTGQSVARIEGDTEQGVTGVVLSNGQHIPCSLVIKATGVRPNLSLVKGTPVKTGLGIVVDEGLQTTVPGIYAAGDVAETRDLAREDACVNANWPNANTQGRLAGLNMAGERTPYPGSLGMNSLPIFGVPVFSLGIVDPGGDDGYRIAVRRGQDIYQKLVFRHNRPVGGIFIGEAPDVGLVNDLIQKQIEAGVVRDTLLGQRQGAYLFRRSLVHEKMQGLNLPWKESLSDTQPYEKRFDVEKWREREQDRRKWRDQQ